MGKVEGEASRDWEWKDFRARLNPWAWALIPDGVGGLSKVPRGFIELKEAWVGYQQEAWNLRLGNQVIHWGVADGINPTNFWNAADFTDPFQSRLLAATTARLEIAAPSLEHWQFELLASPFFRDSRLPVVFPSSGTVALDTNSSRWLGPLPRMAVIGQLGIPLQFQLAPATYPQTWQAAARIRALSLGGWDFSLSGFTGVDKVPRVWILAEGASPTLITLHPTYHREWTVGLDGEKAFEGEPFSVRFELAYHVRDNSRVYETSSSVQSQLLRDNDLVGSVGADLRPAQEWLGTFRYFNMAFLFRQKVGSLEQTNLYTGYLGVPQLFPIDRNLSFYVENTIWRGWVVLRTTALWSLQNADVLLSAGLYSERGDAWHVGLISDFFMGNRAGFLGQYADNSRLRVEMGMEF